MDIDDIAQALRGKVLSSELIESLRLECRAGSLSGKKAKAHIVSHVVHLLSLMGTNDAVQAVSLTRALMVFSPQGALQEIRKAGVFRTSKYRFKVSVAKAVVRDCIANAELLGLEPVQRDYLQSVKNLLTLGAKARQINDGLIEAMKARKKLVIKTLLANLEMLFAIRLPDFGASDSAEIIGLYSNEDLAEAFSYLLKLHHDQFGVANDHFHHIDESAVRTEIYWHLLADAAKICHYKEAELLLDAFPYRATVHGTEVIIEAIEPLLEQSIRLGYIQTVQQMMVRRVGLELHVFNEENQRRPASITTFAEEFYEAGKGKIIFIEPNPVPRYVLGFLMEPEVFKPFSTDELFQEEIEALVQLGIENYDYGPLKNVIVRDDVTALDIMKVQRLLRFVSVVYQRAIADHTGGDQYAIALRSVLPTFSEARLRQFLELVLPGRAHEKVLDLIALDLSTADHVDIQYAPLIKLDGQYLVAPAIVAHSNLTRNIFCSHRIKQPFVGDSDPMQARIADALSGQGFQVAQELTLMYQHKEMETDIVAFKDGELFLFECKNMYHPCNAHEMRNSFDHIGYGAHQLDVRKAWLSSVGEQKRLLAAAGFDDQPVKAIHTCVAVASRVFNGYTMGEHPVRQGHELINTIRAGVVNIAGVPRRVWASEAFEVTDLIRYLQGETILLDCLQSLHARQVNHEFKDRTLSFSTYTLDPVQLSTLSERYPAAL